MQPHPDRLPVGGKSHVRGVEDESLWEMTIPQALARAVEHWPDNGAAVFSAQGERRSYREFASDVDDLALGLLQLGITKGDRVGVWSPNRYEWLLVQFATARIGAILVCINPAYRVSELEYSLNKVGCKTLVTARTFKTSDYAAMLHELCPELGGVSGDRLVAARAPSLESIMCMGSETADGMIPFDEIRSWGHGRNRTLLDEATATLNPREEINIQFTSGTTGSPKGATLTHRNVVNNARFVTSAIEATDQDRICIPVPFYHCFGMVLGTLGCVTKGATTAVADFRAGYYMTMAPLVAKGKVLVGASGGERGIRGFVAALDADTGREVWRSHTVPGPGEPGNETWPGDTWRTGGASIWLTGSYDPDLNLTFWGTGNPGPWIGDQRPGDNLYTNSVVAFDVDTGELKGHHQYHWNGSWDWDEVSAPLLIDVPRDGRTIKGLVHPARNGYLWLLERTAEGINFIDAEPYVDQNVFTSLDPVTGRPEYDPERKPGTNKSATFCPSLWGGKDWPPAAYSPQTGYLYIPANENLCSTLVGTEVEYVPGAGYTGASSQHFVVANADHLGEVQAWNLATGEQVWTHEFERSQNWGPILTTGGGLVFSGGTNDRFFRAFDARTGDVLWEQRTNSGVTGVPSSYEIDGVQYIAVQSGWGVDAAGMQRAVNEHFGELQVPQGGVIWVFALRR